MIEKLKVNENEIITNLQKYNLKKIMKFVTFLFGEEMFPIQCLIFYYFKILKMNDIIFFLFSALFMTISKKITSRKRPYLNNNKISNLSNEKIFDSSFPSGHTLMSYILIKILISNLKISNSSIIYLIMKCTPYLIGFSRIYLGVHYPSDVLMSFVFGIFFIFIYRNYF